MRKKINHTERRQKTRARPEKLISIREHNLLKSATAAFVDLLAEAEELLGVDILPKDCELAKKMPKFRKALKTIIKSNLT